MQFDVKEIAAQAREASRPFENLTREIGRVIVGQEPIIKRMLLGLLSNGHVLLEGVPGLAKTTAVASLARGISASFQRLQFTPDLLPADLVGTQVYHPADGTFSVKKGPIFHNIILADEINRAPAKVQSALLEAMQERQVTIGEQTFKLADPFLVFATQNPIEQEGTYPLPEAQVDRFMLKLIVNYPSRVQEREILDRMGEVSPTLRVDQVLTPADIKAAQRVIDNVYMDDKIKDYIVDIVAATREPAGFGLDVGPYIQYGASPRATIYLAIASRSWAFLAGRGYVVPQDVKDVAMDILRHRVIVSYEAEAEEMRSENVIQTVLDHVAVP